MQKTKPRTVNFRISIDTHEEVKRLAALLTKERGGLVTGSLVIAEAVQLFKKKVESKK